MSTITEADSLAELIKRTDYWKKDYRVAKTKNWRAALGPMYDMYIAPYTKYYPATDIPGAEHSTHSFDYEAHNQLINKHIPEPERAYTAFPDACEYIRTVRRLRRLLQTKNHDSLKINPTNKWRFKIRDILRKGLDNHEAFKEHINSTREDIDVQLVRRIDDVGFGMRPADGSNFLFRVTPSYLSNIYRNNLVIVNDIVTLYAEPVAATDIYIESMQLTLPFEMYKSVWIESHVAKYSAVFHVTVMGYIGRTVVNGKYISEHGRSEEGLKEKINYRLEDLSKSKVEENK
jgi:hypothetical protein